MEVVEEVEVVVVGGARGGDVVEVEVVMDGGASINDEWILLTTSGNPRTITDYSTYLDMEKVKLKNSNSTGYRKRCYSVVDTLQQGRPFKDRDELISSNNVFVFKFFSFGTSIRPYLGIFYNLKYKQNILYEAVWVANRNNLILDIYNKLMIDVNGKLNILSSAMHCFFISSLLFW
ncbi:Bulb-type lectin domain-containing protein [Cynara cardunculus var. scolymus]|uniref:Bulb-type lectin domain-containing protein n=1 Tax=Cynara cardunculus var. scolymus TaxID=59895 RepID=A0A103XWU4_CYNCS|nr:Bulb-type lectin domain-containing protein [Cynara cardunculus var. scolymus]